MALFYRSLGCLNPACFSLRTTQASPICVCSLLTLALQCNPIVGYDWHSLYLQPFVLLVTLRPVWGLRLARQLCHPTRRLNLSSHSLRVSRIQRSQQMGCHCRPSHANDPSAATWPERELKHECCSPGTVESAWRPGGSSQHHHDVGDASTIPWPATAWIAERGDGNGRTGPCAPLVLLPLRWSYLEPLDSKGASSSSCRSACGSSANALCSTPCQTHVYCLPCSSSSLVVLSFTFAEHVGFFVMTHFAPLSVVLIAKFACHVKIACPPAGPAA